MKLRRQVIAIFLAWTCAAAPLFAQAGSASANIDPVRSHGIFPFSNYRTPYVPPVPLGNSGRLALLIRGGKLYLTAQDAVALALENDIDVQVARYTPVLDQWNLIRAEAGGALPGVPSASSQASSVTRGEGVRGSQAAAGVSSGGGNGSGSNTVNATITQIGPVTPTLDPVFQDTTTFSHLSQPQANIQQSETTNLIDKQRNYTALLQDGFLTGTQVSVTYSEGYLNENSPTDILNPQYAPTLQATLTQQFLQGFGVALNSRTINIDKLNLKVDDLNFKTSIIGVVVNVLNLYYGLVADYQDLKAKQSALDVARQFLANNQKQVQLGALAPLDITTAEAQVASSEQDLVTSQTALIQQQVSLKAVISRNGSADPLLADAEIVPLDRIDVPEQEQVPPMKDLIASALSHRVDLEAEKMHLSVDDLNNLGTRNNVLPVLAAQISTTDQGLGGAAQPVVVGALPSGSLAQLPPGLGACPAPNSGQLCEFANPYFVGGVSNGLGQIFRRNYPSNSAAVYMFARVRNRQAQADYAIDQMTARQDKLQTQKDLNQLAVDVSNQVVALQQARVRYLSAVKNRVLQQQLFDAEQKKFALGASTPYNVVTQQRDLSTAQSTETAAMVTFSQARISLQQTLGTTLEENHVNINEARNGTVARRSELPADLPANP